MPSAELIIIEVLTVQDNDVEEAKEMLARSVALMSPIPGVRGAWAVQDRQRPSELAFVGVLDALRAPEIMRETGEAEWHKTMALRWGEILVHERIRRVIGPAVE